jgi:hypothetical protein
MAVSSSLVLNFNSGPVRLITIRAAKAQYRNRPIAIGKIVNDAVDADVCHVLAAAVGSNFFESHLLQFLRRFPNYCHFGSRASNRDHLKDGD